MQQTGGDADLRLGAFLLHLQMEPAYLLSFNPPRTLGGWTTFYQNWLRQKPTFRISPVEYLRITGRCQSTCRHQIS